MKSVLIALFPLLISITVGVPIKGHDIDEALLRMNSWRNLNSYQDRSPYNLRALDSIGGGNLLRSLNELIDNSEEPNELFSQTDNSDEVPVTQDDEIRRIYFEIPKHKYHKRPTNYIGSHWYPNVPRNLDSIGGGNLIRTLDSIGGGHLVKRKIDSIGGGYILGKRRVDPIGGGYLLKKRKSSLFDGHGDNTFPKDIDYINERHLTKDDIDDSFGGVEGIDSIGGGYILGKRTFDSIGGGFLVKK